MLTRITNYQNVLAKIDTGTSFINAPDDVPKKIYEQIPNSKAIGGFYYLPCNSKVLISAKFSGVIFNIDNRDIFDNTDVIERVVNVIRIFIIYYYFILLLLSLVFHIVIIEKLDI
ncbi:acid protease [Gigaspora margarita]|uniref:Acid protease n=1 Tax=Gigaspora margarita TaxID=4874 RepID=A0A8H4EQN0_GIGMA|nr:acid protease [Gigaspora margarita]